MASVVLGTVGNVIGGPLGGFFGRFIGGVIDGGLGVGSSSSSRRVEGYAIQNSAYGVPIPLAYGVVRIAGNVIWSDGLIEYQESESSGGGKGGTSSGGTTTVYRYTSSFAIALCAREVQRIGRIWADGKLIREDGGTLNVNGQLRTYLGSEDQQVDPVMEAALGVGQVPAYRGLTYVVFEDLELNEFANRVPNLTFEVIADQGQVALSALISDLATIGEFEQIDTSNLSPTVKGYVLDGSSTFRDALDDLGAYHEFVCVERGRDLLFKDLPSQAILISDNELGAREHLQSGQSLESVRVQDWELPSEVLVEYLDPARDFQVNVQRARRLTSRRGRHVSHRANVVVTAQTAKAAAERALNTAWTGREQAVVSLPASRFAIEAGDFVTTSYDGTSHPILVEERAVNGTMMRLSGRHYASENMVFNVLADSGSDISQTAASQGVTHFELLDVPLLPGENSDTPRYLFVASGENAAWRSATLFESLDNETSFTRRASTQNAAVLGVVETPPGFAASTVWDELNRPIVQLYDPTRDLESKPELSLFNGANAAVFGGEIIQFRQASALGGGRFELSGLLRGRLGTESAISSHQAGEAFILLDASAVASIATNLGHVGQSRAYKAVGALEPLETVGSQSFFFAGQSLRPLSPVHVRAFKHETGDVDVSWIRRSRLGAEWIDGTDAPLGETSEVYELEILAPDMSVLRQINLSSPEYIYTLAQQQADFGFGISWLHVRIYQLSALVGRGAVADHQFEF
ncbi:MAG: phage tail protein [Sphingomonadales bacterium]|jgi:hypothetical protein